MRPITVLVLPALLPFAACWWPAWTYGNATQLIQAKSLRTSIGEIERRIDDTESGIPWYMWTAALAKASNQGSECSSASIAAAMLAAE